MAAPAWKSVIYDGPRCKIFEITTLDNDAPNELIDTFVAHGMTDFQGGMVPTESKIACVASAVDTDLRCELKAVSATGFTFRKLTPVGALGADNKTWRVTLRVPRGIAA